MYICIYIYIKVMTDGVEEIPIEYQKRPTIVSKETYIYIKVMTDGVEEIPIELRDEREVKYIQGAAPCSPVYLTELLFFMRTK